MDDKIKEAIDLVAALSPQQLRLLDLCNEIVSTCKAKGIPPSQDLADALWITLQVMEKIGHFNIQPSDDKFAVLGAFLTLDKMFFPRETIH